MSCGKYRRSQFAGQAEYEVHRIKIMRLICGPGWEDKPLAQLIAEHPDLYRWPTLHELLAEHVDGDVVKYRPRPTVERQAIEAPKPGVSAEDWLKQYIDPTAPEDLSSNKAKRRDHG